MSATYREEVLVTEPFGLEHIKETERHGTLMGQFNVRFASNMKASPMVLASIGVSAGIGLGGSILAGLLGTVLGAAGTALAVYMGPKLGIPQMLQSRASFGYRGNYIPAFLAWLGYIGWFTVDNIIGAQSGQQLFHVPYLACALFLAIVTLVITIFGYNMVHSWEKIFTWLSAVVFVILTIMTFVHGTGPHVARTLTGGAYWKSFFLEFSLIFSYAVSWATYGADTARYLPKNVSFGKTFWYAFLGMTLAMGWAIVLGCMIGTLGVKGGVIPAIGTFTGVFSIPIYLILFLGTISANVLNLYSGSLSGMTWDMPVKRIGATLVIGIVGLGLSVAFGGQFVPFAENFLYVHVYFVTPWIAIVLIDFYFFNKSGTAYPDFFHFYAKRGGAFGTFRWSAVLSLFIGIAVSIPFMAPGPFTMPIAKMWGGADFSYFVSFIVTGAIYWFSGRNRATQAMPIGMQTENAE